jgi:hypothetical protein
MIVHNNPWNLFWYCCEVVSFTAVLDTKKSQFFLAAFLALETAGFLVAGLVVFLEIAFLTTFGFAEAAFLAGAAFVALGLVAAAAAAAAAFLAGL